MARANLRQAEFGPLDRQKVDLDRQLLTQDAVGGAAAPFLALRHLNFLRVGTAAPLFGAAWRHSATFLLVWRLGFSGAPFLRLSSDLPHFRCITTVSDSTSILMVCKTHLEGTNSPHFVSNTFFFLFFYQHKQTKHQNNKKST
ncbi:hypothetical protein TorRG33x02_010900 [Trema orientale]|uniref:Uncharacterized protein n=1 Tax=Trema orientale TaxID=63057 RepID=A0A2P5FZ42_TREOI|nr:hypothetical protein TorRG33x02_010900 [Trema orientale]